jgi:purine nucleoside permease
MRRPLLALALALSVTSAARAETIAPKVLVITMFGDEARPWLEGRDLAERVAVPGLPGDHPEVACNARGLCLATIGMGFANAASSVTALIWSGRLDLRRSYVVIAGVGGVDPNDGTLGSALWARYAVDGSLRHAIDPRQAPEGWDVLALGARAPGDRPGWGAGTEVFRLNAALADRAFALTRDVALADNDAAAAFRAGYTERAARAAPAVGLCDTVSSNTYWHGSLIAESMEEWSKLMTAGAADYCTTQMEDNATLAALRRGADAGLLDFDRVAVLRAASNFDREPPGLTPAESLLARSGGFELATANAYRVGAAFADAVIADWSAWEAGILPE